MICILLTFVAVTVVLVAVHRAFGRPETAVLSAIKLSGGLTAAFVALSHGPETLAALSSILAGLPDAGPSG